jgi:hypothetical protein
MLTGMLDGVEPTFFGNPGAPGAGVVAAPQPAVHEPAPDPAAGAGQLAQDPRLMTEVHGHLADAAQPAPAAAEKKADPGVENMWHLLEVSENLSKGPEAFDSIRKLAAVQNVNQVTQMEEWSHALHGAETPGLSKVLPVVGLITGAMQLLSGKSKSPEEAMATGLSTAASGAEVAHLLAEGGLLGGIEANAALFASLPAIGQVLGTAALAADLTARGLAQTKEDGIFGRKVGIRNGDQTGEMRVQDKDGNWVPENRDYFDYVNDMSNEAYDSAGGGVMGVLAGINVGVNASIGGLWCVIGGGIESIGKSIFGKSEETQKKEDEEKAGVAEKYRQLLIRAHDYPDDPEVKTALSALEPLKQNPLLSEQFAKTEEQVETGKKMADGLQQKRDELEARVKANPDDAELADQLKHRDAQIEELHEAGVMPKSQKQLDADLADRATWNERYREMATRLHELPDGPEKDALDEQLYQVRRVIAHHPSLAAIVDPEAGASCTAIQAPPPPNVSEPPPAPAQVSRPDEPPLPAPSESPATTMNKISDQAAQPSE